MLFLDLFSMCASSILMYFCLFRCSILLLGDDMQEIPGELLCACRGDGLCPGSPHGCRGPRSRRRASCDRRGRASHRAPKVAYAYRLSYSYSDLDFKGF